jgi:hypothetical protein
LSLEDAVNARVSFLLEQISTSNREIVNRSLQIQVDTLRTADVEKIGTLILQKKKQLENCKLVGEGGGEEEQQNLLGRIEELYSQLDALEWLQKQVVGAASTK